MAKVSIIIPVYNVESYLRRCLDSVVNQTLKDIEIILVNDGATDGSLAICEEYAKNDDRIKIITRKNGGLSAARNTGLDNATSEYIGFIDSDDWVDTNFFENLYNTAIEKNCDVAFGDIVRKGEKKHKIRLKIQKVEVAETLEDKLRISQGIKNPGVWNKIYKRYLFDNLRFEEGIYYEDGEFTIKMMSKCKNVVSVPNIYYYYFVNPTSIVKSKPTLKKTHDKITTRIKVLNYATSIGLKIPNKLLKAVTFKVELLGATVFTVKETQSEAKYYLFDFILVWKRHK